MLLAGMLVFGGLGGVSWADTSEYQSWKEVLVHLENDIEQMEQRIRNLHAEREDLEITMRDLDLQNPNDEELYSKMKRRLVEIDQELRGWEIELPQVRENLEDHRRQEPGTTSSGGEGENEELFQRLRELEREHQRIEEMIGNSDYSDEELLAKLKVLEEEMQSIHADIQGGTVTVEDGDDGVVDDDEDREEEERAREEERERREERRRQREERRERRTERRDKIESRLRASLRKLVERAVEAGFKSGHVRRDKVEECMQTDGSSEEHYGQVFSKVTETQEKLMGMIEEVGAVNQDVGQTTCLRKRRISPIRPVLNALRRTMAFLEGYRQGLGGYPEPNAEAIPFYPDLLDESVEPDQPYTPGDPTIEVEPLDCDPSQAGANSLVAGGAAPVDCESK